MRMRSRLPPCDQRNCQRTGWPQKVVGTDSGTGGSVTHTITYCLCAAHEKAAQRAAQKVFGATALREWEARNV